MIGKKRAPGFPGARNEKKNRGGGSASDIDHSLEHLLFGELIELVGLGFDPQHLVVEAVDVLVAAVAAQRLQEVDLDGRKEAGSNLALGGEGNPVALLPEGVAADPRGES